LENLQSTGHPVARTLEQETMAWTLSALICRKKKRRNGHYVA